MEPFYIKRPPRTPLICSIKLMTRTFFTQKNDDTFSILDLFTCLQVQSGALFMIINKSMKTVLLQMNIAATWPIGLYF